MVIIHIAAEGYPIAKSGGLGDVIGALPKYLNKNEDQVHAILPYHDSDFVKNSQWDVVYEKTILFGMHYHEVKIHREKNNTLGFYTYLVEIPNLFPREKVYGYDDDTPRFILFQMAVLYWLNDWTDTIDIIHCHDHHTGLVPFMCKYVYDFGSLCNTPTVFTIHNGEYSGVNSLHYTDFLPSYDHYKKGYLEYEGNLNPMISAIKCAYSVTTVSEGYMQELRDESSALGKTIREEWSKCKGILNGIDEEIWNPRTDTYIPFHYNSKSFKKGKNDNKKALLKETKLNPKLPLFCFIGRMVVEKGADFLVYALDMYLREYKNANFYIIGSGRPDFMHEYQKLYDRYPTNTHIYLGYNEALARQLYASSDFLLMPSRVEPCGLNQMYAMHYGTIPVVRETGGLKDTVRPIENGGEGFTFYDANAVEVYFTIKRVLKYAEKNALEATIQKNMRKDFSWKLSANKYLKLYQSLININHEL